ACVSGARAYRIQNSEIHRRNPPAPHHQTRRSACRRLPSPPRDASAARRRDQESPRLPSANLRRPASPPRRRSAGLLPCQSASNLLLLLDRQRDVRRVCSRSIDLLRGGLKVGLFREKDVWHKTLRIAIDHGKPRALNLDHDPVTALERVVVRRKANLVMVDLVCRQRFGFFPAIQISTTKHVAGDHELKTR